MSTEVKGVDMHENVGNEGKARTVTGTGCGFRGKRPCGKGERWVTE